MRKILEKVVAATNEEVGATVMIGLLTAVLSMMLLGVRYCLPDCWLKFCLTLVLFTLTALVAMGFIGVAVLTVADWLENRRREKLEQ